MITKCPLSLLERDAVAPVGGEVGEADALQGVLEPLQHQLLGRRLGLVGADLVPQDQVPQQAQDQLGAAVHDVLGACNDSHVMVRMRVIGVSRPAKRYVYLKAIHDEK